MKWGGGRMRWGIDEGRRFYCPSKKCSFSNLLPPVFSYDIIILGDQMVVRRVAKGTPRRRFLWDIPWMIIRAEMSWQRWGYLHDNLAKCDLYFESKPSWVRAYRVWMLLHQMYSFTEHPDVKKRADEYRQIMAGLDKGHESEMAALQDYTTRIDAGLSAGELKRIKRMCLAKPGWRWNPEAARTVGIINGRLRPTC